MIDTSLIVISKDRRKHLLNLLKGLKHSSYIPEEIIIISDDITSQDLDKDYNAHIYGVPYDDFHIGKIRNYGAGYARGKVLFFLDVDCIPNQTYFDQLYNDLTLTNGLCMGTPLYLTKKVKEDFDEEYLKKNSTSHPHRPVYENLEKCDNYALFWSLCFGISKANFDRLGGFDENFIGYGAEDTDFAFMAKKESIKFYLSTATVYHQQHPIYRPPVNHLRDIVYNSNVFNKKWGLWPMDSWLASFRDKGWINWNPDSSEDIEILRSEENISKDEYYYPNAPYV